MTTMRAPARVHTPDLPPDSVSSQAIPFRLTPTRLVLMGLVVAGVVAAAMRYTNGLGAISNMTNVYSFGLWISVDLLCGVALAAGGFTCAATVYILNRKDFEPLVRPSVLTAFLGYLAVVFALLVDLGRPERIWHMLIYWNPHSPLFEIGLCVMSYTTVLAIEFVPILFEGWHWDKAAHFMHKIALPFMILGVVLSTLHQSSLGSLFLMMGDKVNPLWHSPLLPLFFFVSAATAGLAMIVVESSISSHAYGREMEVGLLSRLAKAIPWMLGLLLALRAGELIWSGDTQYLFTADLYTKFYWIEILGGVVLPLVLLAIPAIRKTKAGLITGAGLVVAGLVFDRLNVGLLTWKRPYGATYFPSLGEFAVTIGVISALILTYDWVARNFPLFTEDKEQTPRTGGKGAPGRSGFVTPEHKGGAHRA